MASHRAWRQVVGISMAGRHRHLLGLLLLQHPEPRCAILLESHEASFPHFTLFLPFLVQLACFYLLLIKVKKTNKKLKNYIIEQTKN